MIEHWNFMGFFTLIQLFKDAANSASSQNLIFEQQLPISKKSEYPWIMETPLP